MNGFGCQRNFTKSISREFYSKFVDTSKYKASSEYYSLYGAPGQTGGNGGNGGKGGLGGHPGSVRILEMGNSSEIETSASKGNDGDDGEGGRGGNGGSDGNDATAHCFLLTEWVCRAFCSSSSRTITWKRDERVSHNRRGLSGRNGRNGINDTNIETPDPAAFLGEPAKIINKYKSYLRENLAEDFKKVPLTKFYDQINKNRYVRTVYDTKELVDEFIDLEDQYHSLRGEVDFYPSYKYLLVRVGEYAECAGNCDALSDDKILRSYLYAAVLSKVNSLEESNDSDLIVDIERYFNAIKTEIDLLQDIQNANSKAQAVDEMKKEYKDRIDKKIQEAKYFIENTVDPEINRISREIDNKIDLLIDETLHLQRQVKNDIAELERKKEELRKAIKLKKVFNFLRTLGRVVSFLGPWGMAVGAAIELGTSVGESFALGNKVKPADLSNTAAKLNAVENSIKMMRIENTEYINNVLTELSEKTVEYPEELGSLSSKVTAMKNKFNDIRTNKLPYKEMRKLERELKDTLKTREIDLKTQDKRRNRDVTKVVRKLGQAVEVGSMFVDLYNRNKEEDEKLAAINDAIQQKEDELTMLREYEEQIHETIRPALQDMKSNLQVFSSELNKRSQVALDVGKWQVQTALKDMRTQMQRMTEGMEVKEDLARCLEKLGEAMSMLITIYDRIQQYQDEQILSNHIVNVCSVTPNTPSIANRDIVNAMKRMEWTMRSSLVLKQYQTALKAFKQWVFPFASHYLQDSMLPTHSSWRVSTAAKEIESLKTKISLYKSTVRDTDELLIREEFTCRFFCRTCEPFFVWKDQQYRSEISRLLSGKSVVLKADVGLSDEGKDAIKFRMINLHLKSKNESLQSQLDETLKLFDVTATHTGNSYYRYDKEIYLITNPKKTIFYSFDVNIVTGERVRKNEAYLKFKAGDLMLSPYTTWIFKLNATKRTSFRELDIYKGEIDLELEGKGGYVVNNYGYEDEDYEIDSQLESSEESEFNHRIIRSLVRRRRSEKIATSGAVSSLSSPINSVCSLLKMYTISLITSSFNKILNHGTSSLKFDATSNIFQVMSKNSVHNKFSKEMQENHNSNLSRNFLGKRFHTIDENHLALKDRKVKSNHILCKYNMVKNLDANTHRHYFTQQIIPIISNEKESRYFNQSLEAPDFNCSLLFADFVSRSLTGVKYECEMYESLMSPKHVISKRCNESSVKSESDIIQNLRLFSEMNENTNRSWFGSLKRGLKSVFQSLGFLNKEETDDCIHDIRNLFV